MLVIKRNGGKKPYQRSKIRLAISKANREVTIEEQATGEQIDKICDDIENLGFNEIHVEAIQDYIEDKLMLLGLRSLAKKYIIYRYNRMLTRKANTTDNSILNLVRNKNQDVMRENSNKDAYMASTQRDLIAGEVSKDLTWRVLLPKDVVEAHEQGVLHFHDADYFLQPIPNCCLINIKDMLDNGTMLNGVLIETPKSFRVACNVMTQIIAAVASNQYGGQSVAIKHLGKYLRLSYERYLHIMDKYLSNVGVTEEDFIMDATCDEDKMKARGQYELFLSLRDDLDTLRTCTDEQIGAMKRVYSKILLRKELEDGVQTIQYQINTLLSTNGQSPFLTLFLQLDDNDNYIEEVAMIVEEIIKQRIQGVKNKNGVYTTPAFPKLVYVLDENNCLKGGKYDYITQLCIDCNIKRIYPDYISAKVMRRLHDNEVYSPMGCVDGKEVIPYRYKGVNHIESFERMWERLSKDFKELEQQSGSYNLYMDVDDVEVYDSERKSFVKVYRVIRNIQSEWVNLKFSNGRSLRCTTDHPFETKNRGIVLAKDLTKDDTLLINKTIDLPTGNESSEDDIKRAWMHGITICDSSYSSVLNISLGNDEYEIIDQFSAYANELYNLEMYDFPLNRGIKGNYVDLRARGNGTTSITIRKEYERLFEGVRKVERHIPTYIWNSSREVKLAFLAGMIDADGYINPYSNSVAKVQLGSTNKELAIQQMYLVQSLGYFCRVYLNHYNKKDYSKIRYMCEFDCFPELGKYMTLSKKKCYIIDEARSNHSVYFEDYVTLTDKILLDYEDYSYDVTTESEHFDISGIYSHNCRSFLSEWKNENGDYVWESRFNQGVVSINLPQIGLLANGDMDLFWEELEKRLALCFKALMCRHKALEGTISDVSPIHWQNGALARLKEGETIDKLLHDGFSTISLGYIGLYETTMAMLGVSHTTPEGKEFAKKLLLRLREATNNWKAETGLGFGLYGTPAESLCYRFAEIDKKKFGVVEDITDKGYYTNSYHIDVREPVNAFDKFAFEAEFQEISSGGCISYVEVPNLKNNREALEELVKYIYDTILYAEFNGKSDYCLDCGYSGEIVTVPDEDNNGELVWECPCCRNRNQKRMIVTRRTCGYLGAQYWNVGKTKEISKRVLHL